MGSSRLPAGVDDVDVAEARRRTAVAHRVGLARLTLSVAERPAEPVAGAAADHVHRVPEVRRARLVGEVLHHPRDLPVAHLVADLTGELEVVALLVDRP